MRARFGAWYELFPRSFGGFAGVTRLLPELAELGFEEAMRRGFWTTRRNSATSVVTDMRAGTQ